MSSDLAAYGKAHVSTGIGRQTDYVFEEGHGSYVTTADGTRLLDLSSYVALPCSPPAVSVSLTSAIATPP